MKNVVKLNQSYHPEQLVEALTEFVDNYNERLYHKSLKNLTPEVVYIGRTEQILSNRQQC